MSCSVTVVKLCNLYTLICFKAACYVVVFHTDLVKTWFGKTKLVNRTKEKSDCSNNVANCQLGSFFLFVPERDVCDAFFLLLWTGLC